TTRRGSRARCSGSTGGSGRTRGATQDSTTAPLWKRKPPFRLRSPSVRCARRYAALAGLEAEGEARRAPPIRRSVRESLPSRCRQLQELGQWKLGADAQLQGIVLAARDRRRTVEERKDAERTSDRIRRADAAGERVAQVCIAGRADERVGERQIGARSL